MGMFALVAIPLTCLDLTEMKVMQVALAIFRFVSLATMMATSLAAMWSYPNADAHSSATKPYTSQDMKAFDWANLGLVFPIAIYAQIFHHSVPGLSHPLKNKKAAPRIFAAVLATTAVLYSALGITVGFYYGSSIPQTCTIAWAKYSGGHDNGDKPGWASFISYLVVLFPPIDIISAFPLNAITLGNNLLCAFVEDPAKQSLRKYKLPFRLLAAAPPVLGAMVVRDLGVILKYTGCVGVLIAFVYPCALQYYSLQKCRQMDIRTVAEGDELGEIAPVEKADTPTYNGAWVNRSEAVWVVVAFSCIGLISVIVLSIGGWSN
jgi:amino acid permease